MHIILISKDQQIPEPLREHECEVWSVDEFMQKASNEGIFADQLMFNADIMSTDLYDSLMGVESDIPIVFYRFANFPNTIDYIPDVVVYGEEKIVKEVPQVEAPKPEPQPLAPQISQPPQPPINETKPDYDAVSDIQGVTGGFNKDKAKALLNPFNNQKHFDMPAKVIVFGSSKGGTGKTFTCLATAYWFGLKHPNYKIAIVDFDLTDGQMQYSIGKSSPTITQFYNQYKMYKKAGKLEDITFRNLSTCNVKADAFSANIDCYLAPNNVEIASFVDDSDFWEKMMELLIDNYDVVFFDAGIDYIGKAPIGNLYRIADRIIIITNTTPSSIGSVTRQLDTFAGKIVDVEGKPVYYPSEHILDRTRVVITRVDPKGKKTEADFVDKYGNKDINAWLQYQNAEQAKESIKSLIKEFLEPRAQIIAGFGNIDSLVNECQWLNRWEAIMEYSFVCKHLERITDFLES
jgi:cellulose biosynthesis protein BcsQ